MVESLKFWKEDRDGIWEEEWERIDKGVCQTTGKYRLAEKEKEVGIAIPKGIYSENLIIAQAKIMAIVKKYPLYQIDIVLDNFAKDCFKAGFEWARETVNDWYEYSSGDF